MTIYFQQQVGSIKISASRSGTKCAAFEANVMDAAQYMWRVLSSSFAKKNIKFDPLQTIMEFNRNFPLDTMSEAQTVQTLISAGLPKRYAFAQLSGVDDVDYILDMLHEEREETAELYPDWQIDNTGNENTEGENEKVDDNEKKTDEGKFS